MGKRSKTPTFLLELPLLVEEGQAKRIRAHLEAARQFYNAVLSQGQKRLRQMRADPAWQAARALPRTHKQERRAAFAALREQYGFSEYALHDYAKEARICWLAEHLDAVLAQTLATRAYRALNRVCLGQAKRVRFKSRGRGPDSIENKRNETGLRFVLQTPAEGHQGFLLWKADQLQALIDWNDPVVKHGLEQKIKYARLIRRRASSSRAHGADAEGYRYFVQLALEGMPYHKPKHTVGSDIIGADLGPSTIAWLPGKEQRAWRCWVQNSALRRSRFVAWSARWIDKGERPIQSTTTHRDGSRNKASNACGGRTVAATSGPDAAKQNRNANWLPTAKACMAARFTRS